MTKSRSEKGQALILIVVAIVALIGMSGLAIDGGNAYSDRRNAQNAADTAALAGALVASAGQADSAVTAAATSRSTSNGYDGTTHNTVTVAIADTPANNCPLNAAGKDVTVQIVSNVPTYFARVLGIAQMSNTVTSTARGCLTTTAPLFNGNAVVGLAPSGTGVNAVGTSNFQITGGGIFANSSGSAAAGCDGAAHLATPSVTVVGGTSFGCDPTITDGINQAPQVRWNQYKSLLPPTPACNGTAYEAGGQWYPQTGVDASGNAIDGSQVAFINADMNFTAGLYCVTNSPGPYHGSMTGADDVTFYVMNPNFSMKFNGGGILTAAAPTTGPYAGVLLFMAPQVDSNGNLLHTQSLDLRGNGTAHATGAILAPSADITMYGNSSLLAQDSQIVGYNVYTGGTATVIVHYNPSDNYQTTVSASVLLLK